MYTLQRTGELFEIREEAPGAGMEKGKARNAWGEGPSWAPTIRRPLYDQWKRFVETGQMRGPKPGVLLLESWKRCREMAVDPSPRSCWDFTPVSQLEPFASHLRELTRDIEKKTYKAIQGKNLLITMTDGKGRVVRTCGDRETLVEAEKLNFGPGANWAESSVGTNAIGTALITGRPVQIYGEEHYCRSHHAWNCCAAPVFDPHGNLWGAFDISGPVSSDFSQIFPLVLSAAREVERLLFTTYLADIEVKSRSLVSAVFDAVLTGVLTVDECGRITHANQAAEALLGQEAGGLRGQRADAFLGFGRYLARQKEDPACAEPMTLSCHVNPRLTVRASPVQAFAGPWKHAIVTLVESHAVHPAPRRDKAGEQPGPAGQPARHFGGVLYRAPVMAQAVHKARQAAQTPSTVLLAGETGTGKELFAKAIHEAGPRAAGPFVAVNCGALPRELVQSELFGYRGGAFTGAVNKGRAGKIEEADKGTLFLDEISEMPLEMQVNLLRPLEERSVVRLGGSQARPVDVKVIVATNRDLAELVARGSFRADLYYRINVVRIDIAPLRERAEDVPLLAEHHARRLCREFRLPFAGIEPAAMDLLVAHAWPGNVRELLNCLEYAVNVMEEGVIRPRHLPSLTDGPGPSLSESPRDRAGGEAFRLENVAAETIREALSHHGGNVSHTARALGIGRNTLYAKMRKYGIY
ncbi:sigma-54-dependent Fis family transcriptional regulator [Solidesulfovibrio sp.]|uniref:sigma-54-dependent Fis family transcriptional regulator n=1 Tax=Solidesulfovibrio sp. TaxID=2910990 RepID=UPI002B1EEB39|nr:sigma-54-dependent Fis family transcriptional regulator [Solidesulfovibrio sp.]MEA4855024.1 sigma-54-dependent Fis family transcriptional regulator [Solidesulfovibrio sp.]